ncbi:MAG: hypothetical protein B7Z20_02135 [Sphingobium sp. 32-64-5]|nr:MAG: hypothetical protein B7Z20_02135 [Sphingobium sp. 32-64-5]
MTGTRKAPRRSASASSRKTAAKPTVAEVAAPSPTSRKTAVARTLPQIEEIAELTAADLAVSQEVPETPTAPAAATPPEPPMAVPPAAEPVAEPAEQAVQKGTETMSDVIETTKKYTDEAKERFQSAFSEMSEKAKAGVEKSTKAFEEFSDIAKGNVEAIVESGKIATKAAKSPTEFFQLQSELLSSNFDAFAKESAKASEAMLKLAGDVVQPISTRVSVVTEKVRTFAA